MRCQNRSRLIDLPVKMGADPEWNTGLNLCRKTNAESAIDPQGLASVIGALFLRGWDWKCSRNGNVLDVPPVLLGQSKCLNCIPKPLTFQPCLLFILLVPATEHTRSTTHQSWDAGSAGSAGSASALRLLAVRWRDTTTPSTRPSRAVISLFFELCTESPKPIDDFDPADSGRKENDAGRRHTAHASLISANLVNRLVDAPGRCSRNGQRQDDERLRLERTWLDRPSLLGAFKKNPGQSTEVER